MRLHRLEVTAFGPFAGTESVDLDALSATGLFLLHGPTGAGKSSVLDAVCFALFGRLPGARAAVTRLRSDHAAPDVAPCVLLELSVAGRRLEVTRSPAWERPKRRGPGTTTEPARTLVRELVDGRWRPRTSRNDEAAQLLGDALGMGAEQFTQVVLLPQGEFATFLRSGAAQRGPVLQRLFDTGRFGDLEAALAARRRSCADAVQQADDRTRLLLARAQEAADVLDERCPEHDAADDGDPVATVGCLADAAARACERAAATSTAAQQRRDAATAALEAARALDERHRRRAAALGCERALAAQEEEVARLRAQLDRAGRAAPLAARLEHAGEEAAAAATAREAAHSARQRASQAVHALAAVTGLEPLAGLGRLLGPDGLAGPDGQDCAVPAAGDLDLAVQQLRARAARLDDLVAAAGELRELQRSAEDAAATAAAARAAAAEHRQQVSMATDTRRGLLSRAQELRSLAATEPARRAEVERAAGVVAAVEARGAAAARVDKGVLAHEQARERAVAARERWLDVRQRRLDGMAAELAAGLLPGAPCPVCGSGGHPQPATGAARRVGPDDEAEAHDARDAADADRRAAADELAAAREALARASERSAGLDVAAAAEREAAARSALRAAADAARGCRRVADDLARLDEAIAAGTAHERRHAAAAARAEERSAAAVARREDLRRRLDDGGGPDGDVAQRRDRLRSAAAALQAWGAAAAESQRCERAAADSRDRAAAAARAAGFADVEQAGAALLDDAVAARLHAAVQQHDDARRAVRARLDAVGPLGADPPPDLAPLARVADAAQEDSARAASTVAVLERARDSLRALRRQVEDAERAAAPVRAAWERVDALSRCAEGTGGDNALRMRLSSYVLAARLEQVAAVAGERLRSMSAGRYSLVHSDEVERAGARSGLGLRVVDAWTGREREPHTLSGGETFLASLALALALADVVSAEGGGAPLETFFVDEGFGSLDEDTLEEVLGVLDALREGGRAVGVVSHVADLRARIPARLEVVKSRCGSSLRQGTGP